jgi:hypothetical protein
MSHGMEMSMDELLGLPVTVPIEVAGRALGMGRTKTRQLYQQGEFPCRVLTLGRSLIVTKAALFEALGLQLDGNPVDLES